MRTFLTILVANFSFHKSTLQRAGRLKDGTTLDTNGKQIHTPIPVASPRYSTDTAANTVVLLAASPAVRALTRYDASFWLNLAGSAELLKKYLTVVAPKRACVYSSLQPSRKLTFRLRPRTRVFRFRDCSSRPSRSTVACFRFRFPACGYMLC